MSEDSLTAHLEHEEIRRLAGEVHLRAGRVYFSNINPDLLDLRDEATAVLAYSEALFRRLHKLQAEGRIR